MGSCNPHTWKFTSLPRYLQDNINLQVRIGNPIEGAQTSQVFYLNEAERQNVLEILSTWATVHITLRYLHTYTLELSATSLKEGDKVQVVKMVRK